MLNQFLFNALSGGLSYLSAAVALGLLFASPNLQAQEPCMSVGNNVIVNCGFESPMSSAPWIFSSSPVGAVSGSVVSSPPVNGNNAFEIDTTSTAGTGTLSQTVTSVPAGVYNFSFYFRYLSLGNTSQASVEILDSASHLVFSTVLTGNNNLNPFPSQSITLGAGTYTVEVILTGQTGNQGQNSLRVDSFVLAQQVVVPEPATMIMLGSLCSVVAGYKWKRQQRA